MNKTEMRKIGLEQKIAACWLDAVYWITSREKHKLLAAAGRVEDVPGMTEREMAAVIGPKSCERIMQHKKRCDPHTVWDHITGSGISYTYCQAPDFPQKLRQIPDPPFGLFYKGRLPKEDVPAVAMIGARKCSEYGRCIAEHFARGLAMRGVDIMSGMAMGIDGISQEAALRAGGASYGVLGCGVDIIYPGTNRALYGQLVAQGGVLSEYPPGMGPRPVLFPPRNRIISALADVLLVVEAREKSGTLITVDMALEQGREVYAVPGRCTDTLSQGCNRLLRQGASAAVTPEDIIEDMHWGTAADAQSIEMKSDRTGAEKWIGNGLSETAQEICKVLDIMPVPCDTVVARLRENGHPHAVPIVCQGLVELQLKGIAVSQGGQYRLSDAGAFHL